MRILGHCRAEEINLPDVLAALGDPVRLAIVKVLSDGAEHVQADFPTWVGQSTLSHHMRRLREAGVVWSRPEGTRCFVSLRTDLEQRLPGLLHAVIGCDTKSGRGRSNPNSQAERGATSSATPAETT